MADVKGGHRSCAMQGKTNGKDLHLFGLYLIFTIPATNIVLYKLVTTTRNVLVSVLARITGIKEAPERAN